MVRDFLSEDKDGKEVGTRTYTCTMGEDGCTPIELENGRVVRCFCSGDGCDPYETYKAYKGEDDTNDKDDEEKGEGKEGAKSSASRRVGGGLGMLGMAVVLTGVKLP